MMENGKASGDATEVRAAETSSKGGMAFEVILAEPATETPPRKMSPPIKDISHATIESKLKAAEERRQSLEAEKKTQIQEKLSKIEDVQQKKQELEVEFKEQVKEQLEKKIEVVNENREAYLNTIKLRIKEHEDRIAEVRKSLEQSQLESKENLDKKLDVKIQAAEAKREKHIQEMLDKIREHEEAIQKIRDQQKERTAQLEEKVTQKLEKAEENRTNLIQKKLEGLKVHENRAAQLRQNHYEAMETQCLKFEKELKWKLEQACSNREQKLKFILDRLADRVQKVEIVRQNKQAQPDSPTDVEASSG